MILAFPSFFLGTMSVAQIIVNLVESALWVSAHSREPAIITILNEFRDGIELAIALHPNGESKVSE